MKKCVLFLCILGFVAISTSAFGASQNQNLTVNMAISARAKLTVSPSTINFSDADPDTSPSVAADSTVSVTAKVRTGAASNATLTHLAGGDLTATGGTIAISNITWTGTGTGFAGTGTMNKTTAQSVGSWTGSGSYSGTLTYSIVNSWTYATGNYTVSTTYTLTAP